MLGGKVSGEELSGVDGGSARGKGEWRGVEWSGWRQCSGER